MPEATLSAAGKPDRAGGPSDRCKQTGKPDKAGDHVVGKWEARLCGRPDAHHIRTYMEASLCWRPCGLQQGSPTVREAQ